MDREEKRGKKAKERSLRRREKKEERSDKLVNNSRRTKNRLTSVFKLIYDLRFKCDEFIGDW